MLPAAAADFADAQNELKSALSGMFLEIGSKIVPALTQFIRFKVDKKPQIIAFFTASRKTQPNHSTRPSRHGVEVIWPLLGDGSNSSSRQSSPF